MSGLHKILQICSASFLTAFFFILIFLGCHNLKGASVVDSLYKELKKSKNDTSKVSLLLLLAEKELLKNPEKSVSLAFEAKYLSTDLNYFEGIGMAYHMLGMTYTNYSNYRQALENYYKAQEVLEKTKISTGLADVYNAIGNINYFQANYQQALVYYFKGLEVYDSLDIPYGVSSAYNNIGVIYHSQNNLAKAVEYHLKSLEINEKIGSRLGTATSYNNIGEIYREQGKNEIALDYFFKSIEIKEAENNTLGLATTCTNIGLIFLVQKKYDEALKYLNRAAELKEKTGDKFSIAESYLSMGDFYYATGKKDEAEKSYRMALSIGEEISAPEITKDAASGLSSLMTDKGNYKKALEYHILFKAINDSIVMKENLKKITQIEMQNEFEKIEKQNEFQRKKQNIEQEARITKQKIISYSLSIVLLVVGFMAVVIFRSYRRNVKYNKLLSEQKEEVLITNEQLVIQRDKIEQQAHQLELANRDLEQLSVVASQTDNAIIITDPKGDFIWVNESFTRMFGYTLDQIIQKSPNIAGPDSSDIVKETIAYCISNKETVHYEYQAYTRWGNLIWVQVTLTPILDSEGNIKSMVAIDTDITEQKNYEEQIELQRDMLLHQKKEITDSIMYAQRIQKAVLPDSNVVKEVYDDYFVLFKPRDIVSGDFYYITRVNEYLVVSAADCTGHGIPGAFMSMLGIAMLNDIIVSKDIHYANEVLGELRNRIVKALHQKGVVGEQKDGMDIALCVINTETNEIQYSGANNPLYIVSEEIPEELKSKVEDKFIAIDGDNHILIELKADKMPIAIYDKMEPFTNNVFKLKKSDTIYLFSDGFPDQFGGPSDKNPGGKKFKYKNFKELLLKNHEEPMMEQRELLDFEIEKWMSFENGYTKKPHEQVDDITVVGLRI